MLFRSPPVSLLPCPTGPDTRIFGLDVAPTSPLTQATFQTHIFGLLPLPTAGDKAEEQRRRKFGEEVCSYVGGDWGGQDGKAYQNLEEIIGEGVVNRVAYVSLLCAAALLARAELIHAPGRRRADSLSPRSRPSLSSLSPPTTSVQRLGI